MPTLRDYGSGMWEGGDPECGHRVGGQVAQTKHPAEKHETGVRPGVDASTCRKCGARRVDDQIGLEETPEEYIGRLVAVFREVRRVLKPGRCCFLNLGDSYTGSPPGNPRPDHSGYEVLDTRGEQGSSAASLGGATVQGLPPKNLLGVPWRVALALQADGWWLRNDIIWAKSNGMPSSVRDRFSTKHEHVFLLSNAARYWFDLDAVKVPAAPSGWQRQRDAGVNTWKYNDTPARRASTGQRIDASTLGDGSTRNPGDWWVIPTQPYAEAHYAVFPEALVERCLLAGCPPGGVVLDPFCGRGTVPVVAHRKGYHYCGIDLVDWSETCKGYRGELKQGRLFG